MVGSQDVNYIHSFKLYLVVIESYSSHNICHDIIHVNMNMQKHKWILENDWQLALVQKPTITTVGTACDSCTKLIDVFN